MSKSSREFTSSSKKFFLEYFCVQGQKTLLLDYKYKTINTVDFINYEFLIFNLKN